MNYNSISFIIIQKLMTHFHSRSDLDFKQSNSKQPSHRKEWETNVSSTLIADKTFPPFFWKQFPAKKAKFPYWMTTVSMSPRLRASLLAVQLIPRREAALTFCIFLRLPRLEVVWGCCWAGCVPPLLLLLLLLLLLAPCNVMLFSISILSP